MIDRAPQVAAYLVERRGDDAGPNALWHELRARWPGLTREEASRGARIAAELMATTIAEDADTSALDAVRDAIQALQCGAPALQAAACPPVSRKERGGQAQSVSA